MQKLGNWMGGGGGCFKYAGVQNRALTPLRRGLISHICLWVAGFQQYRKSFRIGHKPFYSHVNDKQ